MKKNIKNIFFVSLLILLLVGIAGVSAADDTTDATISESHQTADSLQVQEYANDNSVKTLTKKTKQNVKENTTNSVDYYVSDTTGSDTNNGTQDSPFKTIQTAIDKTGNDATYNIHIAEGTYKGLKNTNLTVNGNNKINIIGAGINKTVIDGEAKYDIDTIQFHWSSSDIWSFYINDSGNWIMNITKGNGNIKISNFTIQNSWARGFNGGDAINKYLVATIDNYGQLTVDNTYFLNNHGGVGSAIRNNKDATLIVNNSVFEGNMKSVSTGNDGIIYNNGTATIQNSLFDKNYARWGTILNDKNITVENTTLSNNIAYDGESAYSYGAGIAYNTGEADFYKPGFFLTYNTIKNCTFINNEQLDLCGNSGNLIFTGNKFINSTGISLNDYNKNETYSMNISDNIFDGIKAREERRVGSSNTLCYSISSSVVDNSLIITDNKINIPLGTAIIVNTSTIKNNEIIVDNGTGITLRENNSLVENNYITTNTPYTINITAKANKNIVKNNYLVSKNQFADNSVLISNPDNTVEDNLPLIEGIFVSPEVTEPNIGTLENPTTITDALTKVQENGNILLLPGTYTAQQQILIDDTTTTSGVNKFNITAISTATIDANNIASLIKIAKNYDITLNNISIINAPNIAIYNEGNLTINGKATYKNNTATNEGGVIYNKGNVIINGTNIFSENKAQKGGVIYNYNGNLTITGENMFQNNKAEGPSAIHGGVICNMGNLTIEGSNKFVDNTATGSQYIAGGTIYTTGNIIINGSNLFKNSLADGQSYVYGGALSTVYQGTISINISIIGNNTFDNCIAQGTRTINGGALYLVANGMTARTIEITGNTFKNNIAPMGAGIHITPTQIHVNISKNIFENNTSNTGTSGYGSAIFLNNNDGTQIIVKDNNITNNNAYGKGVIFLGTYDQASNITFTKNNITNNIANHTFSIQIRGNVKNLINISIIENKFIDNEGVETIYFDKIINKTIENNYYENTPIETTLTISSEQEGQTIIQNTPITLNLNASLLYPESYDKDILKNIFYKIYVNDENKYNTTENSITIKEKYPEENQGVLNIYVIETSLNIQSNNITINIQRPLNTTIEVTAPDENTVNKSTPMTIMLFDEEGNLIKDATVNMTVNNETEEVALVNGAIVYDFTPMTVGNTTVKFVFAGNDTLNPTETEAIINVVADKDKIIEDLNKNLTETTEKLENTTQKAETLEKQLKDANKTIDNQKATLDNLNKTLTQTQKDLQNANKKITEQNQTINNLEKELTDANNKINSLNNNVTNLNNQVKDLTNENKELKDNLTQANNKIATQDKQIQDLNKSLADANKAIADANKQIKDLNSTVSKLNDQIKNMTTPLDTKITINTITAVKYSSDVKITGTLTDKTGNAIKNTAVTLNINGKASNVATDNKGTYTYTGKANTVGTNNVTVQYVASDKYKASKATSTFKVNKQDLKITINNITSDAYKEDVTVTGVFTDATGKGLSNTNLNLTINGKTVKVKTTTGGVFTYTTKATKVGTNNLTVTYAGNANYNKATTKTTFKVVKQDLIVTIDNLDDVRFKENITISGKFVDGNAKPIGNTILTINLNGKKYTVKTNAQGVYKRSIRVTQIDTNNVTVTYNGNANYNKCTQKATFKAIKQNLGITLDSVKTANGKITVTGTFTDEESKPLMNSNVKVTINGKTYTAKTDNKGVYTLTKTCKASNITLTLSYPGNKNYNSFTKTTKLTV